jgi:hypothetical protein
MTLPLNRLAPAALLVFATTTPCLADSFASSASSAGSASSGSVSDSLQGSSNSSKGEDKVADGDYRVIEVAEAPGRPGMLQLRLQADAKAGEAGWLQLTLPAQALAKRPLAAGDVVSARHRPYGIEFAHAAATREPFFLVLADGWQRELAPRAVSL